MELSIKRQTPMVATLFASLLMGGCAVTSGGSETVSRDDATFVFDVSAIPPGGGVVTGIDVVPVPSASPGQYRGGHARIEVPPGGTQTVVWRSTQPFWIRFEGLKSNKGNGGGQLGNNAPTSYTAATQASPGSPYEFAVVLSKGSGGVKAVSVKYWLKLTSGPGFELDPVIIVDR